MVIDFFIHKLTVSESLISVTSTASFIFVVPFIIFSPFFGLFSDKYPKSTIIRIAKFLEIIVMCIATLAFYFKDTYLGYTTLFFMALQSAFFGPAKYGIIPEITLKERLNYSNSYVNITTGLAAVFGTAVAPFIWDGFKQSDVQNYTILGLVCIAIAILGFINTFFIDQTKAQNPSVVIRPTNIFKSFLQSLTIGHKNKRIINMILWSSIFQMIVHFALITLVPFGEEHLALDEADSSKTLLIPAVFGLLAGSLVVSQISKDMIHLKYTHQSLYMAPIFMIMLAYIGLYFPISQSIYICSLMSFTLGCTGAFMTIPSETYLHAIAKDKDRARVEATKKSISLYRRPFSRLYVTDI